MKLRLFVALVLLSIFACGVLVGIWSTQASAEASVMLDIRSFREQVNNMEGRVETMESLCR